MKRKIIWFILALISIGVILALTLQTPEQTHGISDYVRGKTLEMVCTLFNIENVESLWCYNLRNFRRLAHVPEYFLLGISVYGLASCLFPHRNLWLKVLLICLAVSLTDELIKAALPTREFDAVDMLFDFTGFTIGILITVIVKKGSTYKH